MDFDPISPARMQQRLQQLDTYELPVASGLSAFAAPPSRTSSVQVPVYTPDAAVVANGVVSFVGGMTEQNKEDVRNSYLYASLVASKRHPNETDGADWYALFAEVMNTLGWLMVGRHYSRYTSSEIGLSMDQVGLQALAAAVAAATIPGAVGKVLLSTAGAAVNTLKQSESSAPLKLFNRNVAKTESAQFTLAACTEDADGEVIMAFGAVHCRSDQNSGNLLFMRWSHTSSQVYTGNARMVLNPAIYGSVRTLVRQRLGRNIELAIEQYEI